MPRGKTPESEEFKSAFAAYCALTADEQASFRGKIFSKLCHGMDKFQKHEAKSLRNELLAKIDEKKKTYCQLQAVSSLSVEEIETILEAKKKSLGC